MKGVKITRYRRLIPTILSFGLHWCCSLTIVVFLCSCEAESPRLKGLSERAFLSLSADEAETPQVENAQPSAKASNGLTALLTAAGTQLATQYEPGV